MDIAAQRAYANTAELITTEEPDYPSFLFSERILVDTIRTFQSNFDGLLTYAVKANPSHHILEIMHREGLKAFDVASNREMAMIEEYAPGAALHYNNPIKSRREIQRAYEEHGVRSFTIDHVAQLDQLAAVIPPTEDVEVTVRFKAGKALKSYDFGTKFGVMEEGAVAICTLAKAMGYSTSLCFHVGSQCEEAYAYERHIAAAGRIAQQAGIELKRLNVGGGFPATYPSSSAPPLEVYFETIKTAVADTFGSSSPQLIAEPGRGLVTASTSLLLRVKHQRGEQSVYLNDGVYGSLMEAMILEFMPPLRVWRGDKILTGESWTFTIFGPTCDSWDMMPQKFVLPESITEDDYIEFGLMGAYTQASLTPFNGFDRRDLYRVDDILV
ncbi:hypothetical protein [Pelagibacterium xiamenense]|uniref:hypothetical protein n=1 Tax=Pelagibacterium xiamenense TaxID=2901140 RepID=UPI001E638339|nr:hypothetical protein [Pelagibacterium xiamenense]MCD7061202.1 hypothetical protein [Pelagibacterium xiamenense]